MAGVTHQERYSSVGFYLERIEEPRPIDQKVLECPDIQDEQVVAYFLHIRVLKPENNTVLS